MSAESNFLKSILEFMADDPLTVYYIQYTQGTYDPATSEYTSTTVETPCKAIQLDLTRNQNGLSSVFGTSILAGDKELYLCPPDKSSVGANPLVVNTTNDRVRIGSIVYKIEGMQSIDPSASNVILYRFMLRRQN
jgi:hypothetical protein